MMGHVATYNLNVLMCIDSILLTELYAFMVLPDGIKQFPTTRRLGSVLRIICGCNCGFSIYIEFITDCWQCSMAYTVPLYPRACGHMHVIIQS